MVGRADGHDEIIIRLPGRDDAALFERVAEGVFDRSPTPDLVAAFLAEPGHLIVLAMTGDLVVGMAHGIVTCRPDKPPELFVSEVGTGDDWLRRGIARRTVETLLAEGKRRGCATAWVATETENAAALGLYAALGGRRTDDIVLIEWPDSAG